MLNWTRWCLTLVLAMITTLIGCARDNGLPADLNRHLADQGIVISPSHTHAPLSSRGGYVVVPSSPQLAVDLIATFDMEEVGPGDPVWNRMSEQAGGTATIEEMWGIGGRPAQFKLEDGGQFEYFYLLLTDGSLMYLVAEYAYG
jgi:hypothetical protein